MLEGGKCEPGGGLGDSELDQPGVSRAGDWNTRFKVGRPCSGDPARKSPH